MGKSPVVGSAGGAIVPAADKAPADLVAARMSVSFPILFSAVPLWVLDKRDKTDQVFRRCLFCDGGICSNFPIHLFDSPIPSWPTFGISLYEIPTSKQDAAEGSSFSPKQAQVWLPENDLQRGEDDWNEFETEPEPFERLSGFFSALASTTINWSDSTLARLPGVRERVARVGLRSGIGGLNILMTEKDIRGLADLGRVAALKLLKRYASRRRDHAATVRRLERASLGAAQRASGHPFAEPCWADLGSVAGPTWKAASRPDPPGNRRTDAEEETMKGVENDEPVLKKDNGEPVRKDNDSQLLAAQAAALEGALDALMQAERALNMPTVGQPYTPSPRPVMRVRPPL